MLKILNQETVTESLEKEVETLFKQLSPNKKQIPLQQLFRDSSNPLFFASFQDEGKIVGIASMCIYSVISGKKGWIEDVVVDSSQRGKGIGKQLIEKLIAEGEKHNLTEIYLFTEDEKKAAIALYQKLGFQRKQSQLYNLKITSKP